MDFCLTQVVYLLRWLTTALASAVIKSRCYWLGSSTIRSVSARCIGVYGACNCAANVYNRTLLHSATFAEGLMELFLQFVSINWYWFGMLSLLVGTLVWHENRKSGPSVSTVELTSLVNRDNALVLDIRPEKEFKAGHIVDALNMPADKFESRKRELESKKNNPVVVVCKYGQHSGNIAKQLKEAGFNVSRLRGGMTEWQASQLPTVKG